MTQKATPIPMPDDLAKEIARMRRTVSEFSVVRVGGCGLCASHKKQAIFLSHPLCRNAGGWCPRHGWLYFESAKILPAGEQFERRPRRKAA